MLDPPSPTGPGKNTDVGVAVEQKWAMYPGTGQGNPYKRPTHELVVPYHPFTLPTTTELSNK